MSSNIEILLPDDVFGKILDYSCGRDLARSFAVNHRWRRILAQSGEERWKALCEYYKFPPLTKQYTKLVQQYAKRRCNNKRKRDDSSTDHSTSSIIRTHFAYRDYYIKLRGRVCRYCRKVAKQDLHYSLGQGVPLCFTCRMKCYPLALITTTNACKYFRKVGITSKAVLEELPRMDISYGSTPGRMYRLRDVEELAVRLSGTPPSRIQEYHGRRLRNSLGIVEIDLEKDLLQLY